MVGGPFECIGMDFLEMDIAKSGNKCTLVFQDYLTKWPEVYSVMDWPLPDVFSRLVGLLETWYTLMDYTWSCRRNPIGSVAGDCTFDWGGTVASLRRLSIDWMEWFNRTFKQMLAKIVWNKGYDWGCIIRTCSNGLPNNTSHHQQVRHPSISFMGRMLAYQQGWILVLP